MDYGVAANESNAALKAPPSVSTKVIVAVASCD